MLRLKAEMEYTCLAYAEISLWVGTDMLSISNSTEL